MLLGSFFFVFKLCSDGDQPGNASITSRNSQQTQKPSQTDTPLVAGTQKTSRPPSARPRPDHLPLGSPDPGAHPLYLGVASLTGNQFDIQ